MNFDIFTANDNGMPSFKIFHNEGMKNFGMVSDFLRTQEQKNINADLINAMPQFKIFGSVKDTPKKVCLWDFGRKVNNGKDLKRFRQITGSCVGNGFGQVLWLLQAVEIVRNGDEEECKLPFWLLGYGRSRFYGGLRGRGDGSFGSAMATAAMKDGSFDAYVEGVPQPIFNDTGNYNDGVTWGERAEMDWSDGARIDNKWLTMSRKHLIKSAALCRNVDDVREAIINGYPVTIASSWGGAMRPKVQGRTDPVLLNTRSDTWQHQMCVQGWWEHPEFGELYYIVNSWGTKTHGTCPSGAPEGGFWVRKKDMEYIVKQQETFAFSQFDGFPAQKLDLDLFNIFKKK